MRQRSRTAFAAAVIAASAALAAGATQAAGEETWISASRGAALTLTYGRPPPAGAPPNPSAARLALSCRRGSGVVRIFVAESSPKLQPGETTRLTLTAARLAASATAKVVPNPRAGAPSLGAALPAGSAMFTALARLGRFGRGTLRVDAGDAWSTQIPLASLGRQAEGFLEACRNPARRS